MAPMDLAAPMAARPATPAPMIRTFAGGILPAAVICPVNMRPKAFAASTTALSRDRGNITNQTREVRVYSTHNGPIRRMKCGYSLTTDQSDAGSAGIFSRRTRPSSVSRAEQAETSGRKWGALFTTDGPSGSREAVSQNEGGEMFK
eukprot:1194640-Prorocentrum_minimum.AAC.3